MKKPYFNQEERLCIRLNTYKGANLNLHLSIIKLKRNIFKELGLIAGWFVWRKVGKIKLFEYKYKKN